VVGICKYSYFVCLLKCLLIITFIWQNLKHLCSEKVVQLDLEALFVWLFTLIGNDPEKQCREIYFDFLVCGEVLRVPLSDHLEEHSISNEVTLDVEYFERVPAPEPHDCLLHDDWVSAVQVKSGW
jgi:hypothetical protein